MHLLHNQLDGCEAKLDSMAYTQKKHSRTRAAETGHQQLGTISPAAELMSAAKSVVSVRSMEAGQIALMSQEELGRVFFIIGFGVTAPDCPLPCGFMSVALPALCGSAPYEVWLADQSVSRGFPTQTGGIGFAKTDHVLFGCASITQGDDDHLEDITEALYRQIFDCMDGAGMRHFSRAWHYLPAINSAEQSLERYRRFSIGRHEAFVAKGRQIERDAPAASALGSKSMPAQAAQLVIYFIATASPGTPIENPRQLSAYKYPLQYGPKSPTFARAFLAPSPQDIFYVSGTASIVGHETLHAGDVRAQTRETIANIGSLTSEGEKQGAHKIGDTRRETHIKVYVRHADDIAVVREEVEAAFAGGRPVEIVYFEADICRRDLLVEIELLNCAPAGSQP